jgi:hypothetical protein
MRSPSGVPTVATEELPSSIGLKLRLESVLSRLLWGEACCCRCEEVG